jgi:tetratricopeptide (TPR) repeat protein
MIKEQVDYYKEALNELVKRKVRGRTQLLTAWNEIGIGRIDKALTILDEIKRDMLITDPEVISEVWFAEGYIFAPIKKEYDRAIESYKKAVEIKPDFHEAWYNMGNAYSDKKEYDGAIESYKKAVEIKPDFHEAWYNMGNAYSAKKEYDRAIESYKKAVEIKPDYHKAWYNMGITYRAKKEYDRGIESYKKAVEIKPDYHKAWNNMGIAYSDKKEYDRGIESYKKAVEIKPDFHEAWYNMGNAYSAKKEYDRAIEAYKKAVEFGLPKVNQENIGEFGEKFVAMFRHLLNLKRYEDANSLFRLCEDKAPKDLLEVLYPIKVTIDYLISGNKVLIERQPIEFRKTIEAILKEISKRNE